MTNDSNASSHTNTNNSSERKPQVHKLPWKIAGVCVFGLSILGSFNLAYMLIDREPPIKFIERKAVESNVPQGGILTIEITLDRYRYCQSDINRWLIDSTQTRHAITSYTSSLGPSLGRISDLREITVPIGAATGVAIYYVENQYYCNIIQRIFNWPIVVRSPDIRFNITKYVEPPVKGLNDGLTPTDINNIKEIRKLIPELRFWRFALEMQKDLKQPQNIFRGPQEKR